MAETYHTWYHSPIGLLKISGTEDYISEVSFHDTSQKPEGNKKQFELPLNQEGTIFQQQVWNELQQIPFGKTISYLELARRIGDTKATRAVANANGKNNIAVIVPCHRVIGSNRELVGYAGGLHRKKWLLDLEAKVAYGVQTLF